MRKSAATKKQSIPRKNDQSTSSNRRVMMASKAPWQDVCSDVDKYKLSPEEILVKKKLFVSKHNLFTPPPPPRVAKKGNNKSITPASQVDVFEVLNKSFVNEDTRHDRSELQLNLQKGLIQMEQILSQRREVAAVVHIPHEMRPVTEEKENKLKTTTKKSTKMSLKKNKLSNTSTSAVLPGHAVVGSNSPVKMRAPVPQLKDDWSTEEIFQQVVALKSELEYYEQILGTRSVLEEPRENELGLPDSYAQYVESGVGLNPLLRGAMQLVSQSLTYLLEGEVRYQQMQEEVASLSNKLGALQSNLMRDGGDVNASMGEFGGEQESNVLFLSSDSSADLNAINNSSGVYGGDANILDFSMLSDQSPFDYTGTQLSRTILSPSTVSTQSNPGGSPESSAVAMASPTENPMHRYSAFTTTAATMKAPITTHAASPLASEFAVAHTAKPSVVLGSSTSDWLLASLQSSVSASLTTRTVPLRQFNLPLSATSIPSTALSDASPVSTASRRDLLKLQANLFPSPETTTTTAATSVATAKAASYSTDFALYTSPTSIQDVFHSPVLAGKENAPTGKASLANNTANAAANSVMGEGGESAWKAAPRLPTPTEAPLHPFLATRNRTSAWE